MILYICIGVGVLTLFAALAFKKANKNALSIVALLITVAATCAAVYITVVNADTQSAGKRYAMSEQNALAFGIGKIVKEKAPDAEGVVVITYGRISTYPDVVEIIKKASGKENVELVILTEDPPMIFRDKPAEVAAGIKKALDGRKNTVAVSHLTIVPTSKMINDSFFKNGGKLIAVTSNEVQDKKLLEGGKTLGRICKNPRFVFEGMSGNPETAFTEAFIITDK